LADNVKARVLKSDGTYVRVRPAQRRGKHRAVSAEFSAQDYLAGLAEAKSVQAVPAARISSRAAI
jgi:hypothetical protein